MASALEQTVPMLNAIVAPDLMQGDYAAMQDSLSEIVGGPLKGVVLCWCWTNGGKLLPGR